MGLRIGLSCDELRRIGYSEISWLLYRWSEMNAPESKTNPDVRDATAADIRTLTMM